MIIKTEDCGSNPLLCFFQFIALVGPDREFLLITRIFHPIIFGMQWISTIIRPEPAVYTRSIPDIHHNFTWCFRNIGCGCMFQHAIDVPLNVTWLPIKRIRVESLGRIEAQIYDLLMISNAVCIIIELYFCCVFAKELDINLIPLCAIRRTGIGEKEDTIPVFLAGFILTS